MRTFAEVHLIDKNCNHGADDRTEEVFFDEKVEQALRLKSHSDTAGNGTADGNQSAEHVEGAPFLKCARRERVMMQKSAKTR